MSIKDCFRAHILSVCLFQMQSSKNIICVGVDIPQPKLMSLVCLSKELFVLPNGRKNLDNNKLFWGIFLDTLNIECVETPENILLLHDVTTNKEIMGELIVLTNDTLLSCKVGPTDAQTVGYFYCIVLDIAQASLSFILI